MDHFWVVTIFHFQPSSEQWLHIKARAVNDLKSLGIEEYSLSESEVDEILGSRSYSGGDLSLEVLDEVENTLSRRPGSFRFFFDREETAEKFYRFIKNDYLCEAQLEKKTSQDWNAEWKKYYAPIKVSEELEIVPSWYHQYKSTSQNSIYIYPGMGFGTGSHETTFLCLKLFTQLLVKENIQSVLDFGSGSGILGLSVFKFFPTAKIDFYDIDPEANKNCYVNAEINYLQDHSFRLLLPEVREKLKDEYDLVFGNILESILIYEKDFLVSRLALGGHLILSGLLKHQVPGIISQYESKGLGVVQKLEMGDWAAILLARESNARAL
jgi:ribosomal protein L11 methyltransferase